MFLGRLFIFLLPRRFKPHFALLGLWLHRRPHPKCNARPPSSLTHSRTHVLDTGHCQSPQTRFYFCRRGYFPQSPAIRSDPFRRDRGNPVQPARQPVFALVPPIHHFPNGHGAALHPLCRVSIYLAIHCHKIVNR